MTSPKVTIWIKRHKAMLNNTHKLGNERDVRLWL